MVSVVISQAAATSFIHMQVLAAIQVSQSMRNTGTDSGANGDIEAGRPPVAAPLCSSSAPTEASVLSAVAERPAALPGAGASPAGALAAEGACGGKVGAVLRGLSWDGKGGMCRHCAAATGMLQQAHPDGCRARAKKMIKSAASPYEIMPDCYKKQSVMFCPAPDG